MTNRKYLLYIYIAILAYPIFTSTAQEDAPLFPITDACGFLGYMNTDGEIKIRPEPEWRMVYDFSEGVANILIRTEIGKNKKLGNMPIYKHETIYIDKKGNIILKVDSENSFEFISGLAAVKINGKYGYLNMKGEIVIQPQFDLVRDFFSDRSIVEIKDDKSITTAVIDKTGKIIFSTKEGAIDSFSESLAVYYIPKDDWSFPRNHLYGFIDVNGKIVIKPQYRHAGDFHDGISAVSLYDGRDIYIDKKGNEILKNVKKTLAGSFSEGLGKIMRNGKWGFIDVNGIQVIECKFPDVANFSDGMAAFSDGGDSDWDRLWGFLDRQGKVVCEPMFAEPMFFKNGLARVLFPENKETGYANTGYVNKKGEIIFKDDKEHCIGATQTARR